MSAGFGHNKGKDGKYNTLNLTQYKGRSTDSSKHTGVGVRHGLQSLGKVAATRRVPPPASLPSLKSENLGNDPNVNLVPKDGSGWASKPEATNQQQPPQQVQPQSQSVSQQRQASVSYSQASTIQTTSPSASTNQNQATSQSNGSAQPTWGAARYSQAVNKIPGQTGGAQAHGTTHFSEEFPTLGEEKELQNSQGSKSKEQQYGPGPNLRPQNVASWRGGGGQNLTPKESYQSADDSKGMYTDVQSQMGSGSSFDIHQAPDGRPGSHPSVAQNLPPQHYHAQFRPNIMPPQYMGPMYNNRFPHPGMPASGVRYQSTMMSGMRYPPVYPNDPRFRGMMNPPMPTQPQEAGNVQSIIPQSEFKEFDKLEKEDEGGWAGMHGEVDYGEKLVFSDDEDNGKQSAKAEGGKSKTATTEESRADIIQKETSIATTRQAWTTHQSYEQQIMAQWSQQQYYMYRGPMPSQPQDYRSAKSQPPYDKHMPPQGHPYPPGQMAPPPMYASHPPAMGVTRFVSPVDAGSGRLSPRGDEEPWKKNEKEEAVERARKRREEEEKRMELQRSSSADNTVYYQQADFKRAPPYPHRYPTSEEEMHHWQPDFMPPYDDRVMYGRRTESESSDDRRAMRDRMPGDGYGGSSGYRPQPRPSAGGVGGRNLPPRLANQRQKLDTWQARTPSPGYQPVSIDSSWMAGQPPVKQAESRVTGPSIMKRERVESEGAETQDSRVRSVSESSSHSLATPSGEGPPEDKKNYPARDFYRKDDRKIEERRIIEDASPSTTSSDREPRLWDAGTGASSKRSSIKRQSSRDSPVSTGSGGDSRYSSQKTLLSRNDNRSKPVTRWGSNQSNQSVDKEELKQPATLRPRRINDNKVKLRDFRVESEDEDDLSKSKKSLATKMPYKPGKNYTSKPSVEKDEYVDDSEKKTESKVTKPIATVSPTATTTTAVRDSQKSFAITRITRDVDQTVQHDGQHSLENRREDLPYSEAPDQDDAAWDQDGTRSTWDEDEESSAAPSSIPKESSSREYSRQSKTRHENRGNRNFSKSYNEPSDWSSSSHRYSNKEARSFMRGQQRESRDEVTDSREDNRGVRRYRTGDSGRYHQPSDRNQRSNTERFDNRNRRDNRDSKSDRKENDASSKGKGSASSQQSQRLANMKNQSLKQTGEKSSIFAPKPTAAAAPMTNIWEERKKQQQVQQEVEKNIYIPTEDDRKRTLKETAPNPTRSTDDTNKFPKDDKPSSSFNKKTRDDHLSGKNQEHEPRRRQNALPEKRFYEAKPFRTNNSRRGSSSQSQYRGERKPSRSLVADNNEREQRNSGRGRGRSRGSSYRGRGGRGQNTLSERSVGRNSAPPRGRGSRPSYRSSQHYSTSSRSNWDRERIDNRRYDNDEDDDYDSTGDESYESEEEPITAGRRRRVGEGSEAEDDFSSEESFSDSEGYSHKPKRDTASNSYPKRGSRAANSYKSSRPGRGRAGTGNSSSFTARGEPSRRGRGRGAPNPRGRGRGLSRGTTSAPPTGRSYRSDDYNEVHKPKNLDRGPSNGADKRLSNDRRKRRPRQDRPPRFKNSGRSQQYSRDRKPSADDSPYPRQDATSPVDTIHSSDVGNDEWETASDNSHELKKAPLNPPVDDIKRNEPKRSFSGQRPPSNRGRAGRGAAASDRNQSGKKPVGKMDNQVYTLHTVDYSNPSAIEGAIRDASGAEAKVKKQEEAQKTKHEDLFRLYDLNNYAGVVSVDDLPDSSLERKTDSNAGVSEDLSSFHDTSFDLNKEGDGDGFTPVMSRKSLRKKQEVIRKKDKEEQTINEALRRAKIEQQQHRQNRQKFFNKSSTSGIVGGTSGSIKQSISTSVADSIWSSLDTWAPTPSMTEQKETNKDASISQHDSGVESSVPSSQRSSPGTETKLSFSHFGVVSTSTSVITSIGNHPISSSVVVSQSSASISNLISTQTKSVDQNADQSEVSATAAALDFNEVAAVSRSPMLRKQELRSVSPTPQHSGLHAAKSVLSEISSTLQHSGLHISKTGLNKVSASNLSPSRMGSNPIVPIGNERMKSSLHDDSIENITCLFPLNEKNRISFIADDSEDKSSSMLPDDVQNPTFSPYAEHSSISEMRASVGTPQAYTGFSQDEYSLDQTSSDITLPSVPSASFSVTLPSGSAISNTVTTTMATTMERQVVGQPSFVHQSTAVMTPPAIQGAFLDGSSSDISATNQSMSAVSNAGIKSDSDTPNDMPLPPQAPANDNVGHNGRSLEGTSSVPGPIPMPPKHGVAAAAQRPDGDSQIESRQLRDVNTNANGAGDMGLMTPTSPSVEFNKKMESARKAWQSAETSGPPAQQAHGEPSDGYAYHQSTAATGSEYQPVESSTTNLSSATLSVTNSTEWKPRATVETTTASSEVDEAWRNKLTQQNQNTIAVTQPTRTQSFTPNPPTTSTDEIPIAMSTGYSTDTSSSITTAQTLQQQKQVVVPTYSSSGGLMYVDPAYNQTHRLATPQVSHSNLYSSSLATNLHNMQQAYPSLPPDYPQSMYSATTPAYNTQHPTYNPAQRDFAHAVMFATTTTMTSTAKAPSQNTFALKPIQKDLNAYVGNSAIQGLDQQTNIGSAHLGIPRPQAGPSPAQPITYIPVVDQNRIQASQAPIVNQTIATPQRPHSSSFYSQINQAGSNYYPPPAASQLRQQHSFQQAIVAPQSVTYTQGLGLDSSSIWSLQQTPSYTPMAPPTQRIRSDAGDYQTQGYQFFQKNVFPGNKFVPSPSQTPGSFGATAASSNAPSSNFGSAVKPNQIFSPKASSSSSQDISKFSMTAAASTSPTKLFGSQPMTGDWNKSPGITNLQYKNNSVQGILSRPFSSSTDASYQQSPGVSAQSMLPKQDMNMPPRMNFSQPTAPQTFNPSQPGWGQKPPQGNQGIVGAQPPSGLMAKVPRPPISVMGQQRFAVPPNFQQQPGITQMASVSRNTTQFSLKPRPTGPGVRLAAPPTSQQFTPTDNTSSSGKGSKTPQTSSQSHGKTPPVPTLVRGAGSNLVGKKPTFMPEEVVKTNQANERANLLQSLSSFFPDKDKPDDGEGKSQDWSTQVANSSPLPKRKPGMRHPGIEKRKTSKDQRTGPIGSSKNLKRLQRNKKEEAPVDPVESVVRPVKKMTLADTKPKKGEIAKIKLG